MATLPTLLVTGDSVNGPRDWAGQGWATIDEGIAAFDNSRIFATTKTNNNDTSFLIANMPSDFSTMLTLSFQVRCGRASTTDDLTGVQIRIVTETGGTVLAADDSGGTFQEVVALGRDGPVIGSPLITGSVIAFTYVNTTATKAQWDDAR